MQKITIIKSSYRTPILGAAVLACFLPVPAQVMAATTNTNPIMVVQMRGNANLTPTLLKTMSSRAGTPLQVAQNIGKGSYLVRATRAINAQAARTITSKLASHPSILSAGLYQKSTPTYVLAPAGHRLTLNAAHLVSSTSPLVRFHWQQISGANTGTPSSSSPAITFLAKQAATPTTTVSDPTAITPGDLSTLPQQVDCAISAASVKKLKLTAATPVSKQDFLCNGNGAAPASGSTTPPDSGLPGGSTPGGGTPSDSGLPGGGTPSDSGLPSGGTPSDTSDPSDSSTPSSSGTPNFYGGGSQSSPSASGGNNWGGGSKDSGGGNYGGGGHHDGGGDNYGGGGGGCDNMSSDSVKSTHSMSVNSIANPNLIGYQLIATDKAGTAHVRNIYIKVQGNTASKAPVQKAVPQTKTAKSLASLLSKVLQTKR